MTRRLGQATSLLLLLRRIQASAAALIDAATFTPRMCALNETREPNSSTDDWTPYLWTASGGEFDALRCKLLLLSLELHDLFTVDGGPAVPPPAALAPGEDIGMPDL